MRNLIFIGLATLLLLGVSESSHSQDIFGGFVGSKKVFQFTQPIEIQFENGSSLTANLQFKAAQIIRDYELYSGVMKLSISKTPSHENAVGESQIELTQKLYSLDSRNLNPVERDPLQREGELEIYHQRLVLVKNKNTQQVFIALKDVNSRSIFDHRLQMYFEIKAQGSILLSNNEVGQALLIDNRDLEELGTLLVFDNAKPIKKVRLSFRPLKLEVLK